LIGSNGRAIGLETMQTRNRATTVEEIASGLGIARRYQKESGEELSAKEIVER